MNIQIQNTISKVYRNEFQKYEVTTLEAIGLLESIKLPLFNDSIKKVEQC